MVDIVSLLPNTRRGWSWVVIVLGVALSIVVWFAGPASAAAAGTAGGVLGLVLGVIGLLDRRRGGWWAAAGVLLVAAGVAAFAALRGA